ncbi:type II toxin-antitoxin system RelB/DinJ family antitoxin [Candidatus Peregrinibacteria bacterium]|nr:type II toxin-antitoxin system RelB/DinJ family antitoxin [Candidatus Peregrinibacteria bacterium]MBI3816878.1 type II toxin-antitoxin system RelB/DinJ family antitoxin [Candidatus Peregrinibacteria bacterium]
MMKKAAANLHIRLPAKLKREAEKVIQALGLDTSSAIRLFYTQITLQGTLPFELPKIRPMSAKTRKIVLEALNDDVIGPFDDVDDFKKALHAAA